MAEYIVQHIITKGGESYTQSLGVLDDFNVRGYMAKVTNTPPFDLIEAEADTFVAFDVIAKLWFTRMEVH